MATYLARYVPKFSDVTAKLRELLCDDVEFRFGDVIHGRALQQLKELLVNVPVLRYYDVNKTEHKHCDSSSFGTGATLLQDGQPVEYAPRSLTRVERGSSLRLNVKWLLSCSPSPGSIPTSTASGTSQSQQPFS